jgi:hypothetical protein
MLMADSGKNPFDRESIAPDMIQDWRTLIDIAAELLGAPAGLITRRDASKLEIFLSSKTEGNPYTEGYAAPYPESGFYCEWVIKNRTPLEIPDARDDLQWKDNDAVGLNMVSYAGFPIMRPDGEVFGTICFLSDKGKPYNEKLLKLVEPLRRMIELSLRLVIARQEIADQGHFIQGLSRVFPICMYCKKVRTAEGKWVRQDEYIAGISGLQPSHGVCPDCCAKEMDDMKAGGCG